MDAIKKQLETKGFVADTSSNVFSRQFTQACPRDSITNERQILYITLRSDDRMSDFKVLTAGRTGVMVGMTVTDVPFEKTIQRITEIQGRFADAIAFFQ